MSKPRAARYRSTNWSSYNASLRKRGSLVIRVDKDMTWRAPRDGRPGLPAVFSDAAIQFRPSIKVLFKLPLRQTAGMVASLLRLAGPDWPVPDFSTLWRRQKTLAVQVPYRRADGPPNLLVDIEASTGRRRSATGSSPPATVPGRCRMASSSAARANGRRASMVRRAAGEPCRAIGPSDDGERRKVHLAMGPATSDIRAVEFTPGRDGDTPVPPDLPGQIPADEQIGRVTAGGAYDTPRCYTAIIDRQATPFGHSL